MRGGATQGAPHRRRRARQLSRRPVRRAQRRVLRERQRLIARVVRAQERFRERQRAQRQPVERRRVRALAVRERQLTFALGRGRFDARDAMVVDAARAWASGINRAARCAA